VLQAKDLELSELREAVHHHSAALATATASTEEKPHTSVSSKQTAPEELQLLDQLVTFINDASSSVTHLSETNTSLPTEKESMRQDNATAEVPSSPPLSPRSPSRMDVTTTTTTTQSKSSVGWVPASKKMLKVSTPQLIRSTQHHFAIVNSYCSASFLPDDINDVLGLCGR
jgi:hypothetical protein